MLHTAFQPWPSFTEEEADAVRQVLLSNKVNYWTGLEGRAFEEEFARAVDCDNAVALANGTVALEAALRALDLGPGDEVIVTPRTFLASASSIVAVGARPVFVDVDADSQNITAQTIAPALTARAKAIVCVHLAGWPCDMDGIMDLARAHGLAVIEDCAQAHGAAYQGRPVGGLGHIGAWSFCQDKILTTGGEGGMVTTNDPALWSKVWAYKDHGKSHEAVVRRPPGMGFVWLHTTFGTNSRMTEMQAAIGRIQLRRLPDWHASRQRNAQAIWSRACALPGLRVPTPPPGIEHACYKCYVFVRPRQLKTDWNRDRILGEMTARGIPCYSGSCSEVYLEKAFDNTGWCPPQRLPVARELGETSLMFLVHPTLTAAQIEKTCCALSEVMGQATR